MHSKWIMFVLMAFYVLLVVAYIREHNWWKALYFVCALGINFAVYMM